MDAGCRQRSCGIDFTDAQSCARTAIVFVADSGLAVKKIRHLSGFEVKCGNATLAEVGA